MVKNKTDTVIHQLSYVSFCNMITRLGGLLPLLCSLASHSPSMIEFVPAAGSGELCWDVLWLWSHFVPSPMAWCLHKRPLCQYHAMVWLPHQPVPSLLVLCPPQSSKTQVTNANINKKRGNIVGWVKYWANTQKVQIIFLVLPQAVHDCRQLSQYLCFSLQWGAIIFFSLFHFHHKFNKMGNSS